MAKFPVDAPIERVVKALQGLGFTVAREGNHVAMVRKNPDGSVTPLTLPGHRRLKASTLRTLLRHARISREDFLAAYERG